MSVEIKIRNEEKLDEWQKRRIKEAIENNRFEVEWAYENNPCYVGTIVWGYGHRERIFTHNWKWICEDNRNLIFDKLSDAEKLIREGKFDSLSLLPYCPICKTIDYSYRKMSNISRGLQRYGLRNRKGPGATLRREGKQWRILSVLHNKQIAEETKSRLEKYNPDKHYEIFFSLRTKYYGSILIGTWFVVEEIKND